MNSTRASRRALARHRRIVASVTAALFGAVPLAASTFNWFNDNGTFSAPGDWLEKAVPPLSDPSTQLLFGGSGGAAYTATNDLAGGLQVNALTLNSSATVTQTIAGVSGSSFNFVSNGAAGPSIVQNGSGAFAINSDVTLSNDLSLKGGGTGVVTLGGTISGAGALAVSAGNWQVSNVANTWGGGTVISGGVLEVAPAANTSISLSPGANSALGTGAITINGGELKLTATGTGTLLVKPPDSSSTDNRPRPIAFGANGGVLNLNGAIASNGGGSPAPPSLLWPIVLPSSVAAPNQPAVLKFNGGAQGVSNASANGGAGDWGAAANALRLSFTNVNANNPIRIEVTNGALLAVDGAFGGATFASPLTWRGVIGGDPSASTNGKTVGRAQLLAGQAGSGNNKNVYTFTGGLNLEGALQVSTANDIRTVVGNINVKSGALAAFAGRGTGTAIVPDQGFPLQLGVSTAINSATSLLTVESGGTAIFDARYRTDVSNQNGVRIFDKTVLQAGGALRIKQSWAFGAAGSPPSVGTSNPVGYMEFQGDIVGTGTAANESVIDVQLPFRDSTSAVTAIGGVTFGAPSSSPGLTAAATDLIVNGDNAGTGGGLRITATARDATLYTQQPMVTIPNPKTLAFVDDGAANLAKLNGSAGSIASAQRLAALTGSGGYLTIAPSGSVFPFPAGGEWAASVPVGLKVVDHNPGGDDVSLSANFVHNINVDSGATLNAGGATLGPAAPSAGLGLIKGVGTISGGVTINTGAVLAPGFGVGALTFGNITINGVLQIEATSNAGADQIVAGGSLTLGSSSTLDLPLSNTYSASDYTIATYTGTLSGTFNTVLNLPANFSLDYATPGAIKLHYAVLGVKTWNGNLSGAWAAGSVANWQGGSVFNNGENVVFDDTAAGPNFNVTVSGGDVSPALITVNNTNKVYSIISSPGAAITGSGQLVKNGSGVATLSGPAAYTGGTKINAGTLKLGANDSLPDVGPVTVAAGATLDTQAHSDTLAALLIDGAQTGGGTLTVSSLTLGSGATANASYVLNGDVTKTGAAGALSGAVDLNGGARTFAVAASGGGELTLSGVVSNGTLVKEGAGTLVLANAAGSNIGATINAGALDAAGGALSLSSLSGTGGVLALGAGSLTVAQAANTTFAGNITGSASAKVVKTGAGVLTLSGGGNAYGGGLDVNGGTVIVAAAQAAGAGSVRVNPGGIFATSAAVSNPVILAGGTAATQSSPAAFTSGSVTAAAGTTTTVLLAAPGNLGANSEFILTGTLGGSGNINVVAGTNNPSPDGGPGFRLRGTGASDFSGVITAGNSAKLEMQTAVAGPFTPAGTGKFVFTAGIFTGGLAGTYSQINLRNNSAGNTVFGNDSEIVGTGFVNFNPVGSAPAGSVSQMGNLKIGGGQTLGVNKNGTPSLTVAFSTVTLTGGDATFAPNTSGFGASGSADLVLGAISETSASGIVMDGLATLTLNAANSYTGATTVNRGVVSLGAAGALPAGTALTLTGGAVDLNSNGASFDQTVGSLGGSGGSITNSDFANARTLTVNQSASTVFAGSLDGNLGLTKRGNGVLQLTGFNSLTGPATVVGGTLNVGSDAVHGSIAGSAVTVQNGGAIKGYGVTGALTAQAGATVAPGNGAGGILTTGNFSLSAGAMLSVYLSKGAGAPVPGVDYAQVVASDATGGVAPAVQLGGSLQLTLGSSLQVNDIFTIILNDGSAAVGGTFAGLSNGATFSLGGAQFQISYFDDAATPALETQGGNDVSLKVVAAVPEPGTCLTLASGFCLLAGLQRFRGKRRGVAQVNS